MAKINPERNPASASMSTQSARWPWVKLWEVWRDRFRIDVGRNLTGSPEIGNEIFIRNLAGNPVILSYWELQWREGRWPFHKYTTFSSPEELSTDSQIEAHSSLTLTFSEQDHFSCGHKAMNGRKIFIRLYICGKRPLLRKIHG